MSGSRLHTGNPTLVRTDKDLTSDNWHFSKEWLTGNTGERSLQRTASVPSKGLESGLNSQRALKTCTGDDGGALPS